MVKARIALSSLLRKTSATVYFLVSSIETISPISGFFLLQIFVIRKIVK